MTEMNRRELLTSTAMLATSGALAPVKTLAAAVQPIRIKNVETFNIEIPATVAEVEAGVTNRIAVTRVVTESGVRGYSFGGAGGLGGMPGTRRGGAGLAAAFQQIRNTLVGSDLFAI